MKLTKIRTGQTWVSKDDGRLIFIGKKHDGMSWNTTNNLSHVSHRMTDLTIQKYYKLLGENEAMSEELKEVVSEQVVVKSLTNVTFKKKPWYLPKPIHKWIIKQLLDVHEIKVKANH